MTNNLQTMRKAKKMTLECMAQATDSSKSYIWDLENNNTKPSIYKAYAIAGVLGVSVYDIFPDPWEYEEKVITTRAIVNS